MRRVSGVAEESWTAANDVESAMSEALRRGDARRYLEIVAEARLYLPAFEESGPQRLVTFREGDQTCLPVFTSGEAMVLRLTGVPAFRTTTYRELAEKWPDPAWLLAVDPGLPIGALLPIGAVTEALSGAAPVTPATPATDLERALLDAVAADDMDALARVLILAEVHLPTAARVSEPVRLDAGFPWHRAATRPPTVAVFTSVDLLTRALPGVAGHVVVPLLDLALAWPDPDWQLVLNPGSPTELTLPGPLVRGLVARAAALVAEERPEPPAGAEDGPAMLVKVLPQDQIEWYLEGNWHQVTGRVFRYAGVRDARTPAALHAALGGYLPFRPDDAVVHLVRWSAVCPALYRSLPDGSLRARAVTLPHGAQLHRLDARGHETWLASFDADAARWITAPDTTTLRQAMRG